MGGAPITFVQHLLGHESPSLRQAQSSDKLRTGLASTGIYTQLVDQMAKEIALNTRTAIDDIEPTEEGQLLKEGPGIYDPEFQGWDDFVGQVLDWLGDQTT